VTAERDTRPVRAPHDRPAGLLFSAIAASLTLGCLAGLWRVTAVLGLRVPLDPNEGWNAYHAAAAMAGQGPYPAASSFMTDNYPPLSFYVVGALGKVFGDNIVAGRILSLLSFAVVAGGIAALARRFGCNLREAAFASLLFAGFGLAVAASSKNIEEINYPQYLVVFPMFLFCGVFYPLESLPRFLQYVAWVLPLTSVNSLVRTLTLGFPFEWWSLPILGAWLLALLLGSRRLMTRRLVK